jgi:hypothetical protein
MKFKVEIKETTTRIIEVEAQDEDEAVEIIEEKRRTGEMLHSNDSVVETDIYIYEGED